MASSGEPSKRQKVTETEDGGQKNNIVSDSTTKNAAVKDADDKAAEVKSNGKADENSNA